MRAGSQLQTSGGHTGNGSGQGAPMLATLDSSAHFRGQEAFLEFDTSILGAAANEVIQVADALKVPWKAMLWMEKTLAVVRKKGFWDSQIFR